MKLFGPFKQLITFQDAADRGSLSNENLGIIKDAGLLEKEGRIIRVGDFSEMRAHAEEIVSFDEPLIAMPGFIDCHTHMIWGGSRAGDFEKRNSGISYQQILDEGGGIFDTVRNTTDATDQQLKQGLNQRMQSHLMDGITTIEIKSGYGLTVEQEIRLLRLIKDVAESTVQDVVSTFLGAHVSPVDSDKGEYLEVLIKEAFPIIKEEGLSLRVDAFVEKEAFPADIALAYLQHARKAGFHATVHAGQFSSDGVYVADQAGAISADHLESISDAESRLLGRSKTVSVALPGASIGLGLPFAPARKLLDAGACLAIATDWNPGSAPQGDLLTQSALLGTYQKLSSAEILAAITYRAAAALALPDRGKLIAGKISDFVCFPTSDYREVLYQMGRLRPCRIIKRGKEVYKS